ncbi:unnamed protein product [Cylicocyclus nassatus]|uniref:Uncharacterized protein n=1 Tax=Cylicocyclus nassatus TaxID=53992 RepID=A0AA36DPK7_CYLNA|nr:unnamed protein product [Cylicocyclus nassatus]
MLPALMLSGMIGNVTFCGKDPSKDFVDFVKVVDEYFKGRNDVQAKYNCAIAGMDPKDFDAEKSQFQLFFPIGEAQKTAKKIEDILSNIRRVRL